MNDSQLSRLKQVPKSQVKVFEKAYSGNSKAKALVAKCLDCCCYERTEVRACTTLACPLWPYRPFQAKVRRKAKPC